MPRRAMCREVPAALNRTARLPHGAALDQECYGLTALFVTIIKNSKDSEA